MPTNGPAIRLLVKTTATGTSAELTMANGGGTARFTIEPIGRIASPASGSASGAATAMIGAWQIWTLQAPLTEPTLWDLCHRLVEGKVSFDGGTAVDAVSVIEFAEPVFQQTWGAGVNRTLALAAAGAGAGAQGAPEDPTYPTEVDPYWFRDTQHAQFDNIPGVPGAADATVRVAHLDTGYDPNHLSLPAHMNYALEQNFVDPDQTQGRAVDDSTGFLNNLGHGTGTLGILAGRAIAGQALGGAPDVEVVPIRVANSVVLFGNDAVTQALQYVWEMCQDPTTRIHVVTMSMGGLPCQAWVEYVNLLYEAGVFIVTASGDNFGNLPVSMTVYPALFQRVVGACGVMADFRPYADLPLSEMAGNYGPPEKMTTAMAAYTPNVPWARIGSVDVVNFNGAGTSAATPQIAAAAANWIQQHKAEWDGYSADWMRVEAVRKALSDSATKSADTLHIGQGMLRAADALALGGFAEGDLTETPADTLVFPFLDLIPAEAVVTAGGAGAQQQLQQMQQRMLELEALQHAQASPAVHELVHGRGRVRVPRTVGVAAQSARASRAQGREKVGPKRMAKVRAALVTQSSVSQTLRAALQVNPHTN